MVVVVVVVVLVVVVVEVVVGAVVVLVTVVGTSAEDSDPHAAITSDAHTNDARPVVWRTAADRNLMMTEPTLDGRDSLRFDPLRFDVVAFDADDTLWHSEDGFHAAEQRFCELLAPYASTGVDVMGALVATERANLHVYGYGVKAFGLSMIEAALTVSGGKVPATVLEHLIETVRDLLLAPVRLLDAVPEVLSALAGRTRLVLITKGDLVHQTRKVRTSGLEHHFHHIEIVLEKDVATYERVLRQLEVEPDRFCMIGNSVKSDALPVLELGGHAVHVPYEFLWELEHAEKPPHHPRFHEVAHLREVPTILETEAQ